jgi:hypothetical protein
VWKGAAFALSAVDVNGDGFADLISSGLSLTNLSGALPASVITVMLGDGKGNFKQAFTANDSGDVLGVSFCLADPSGRGRLDLLETFADVSIDQKSVGISIGVRAGNGDGSFQDLQKFAGPQDEFPFASICADLNGDGLTDVAYTGISFPVIASLISGTAVFKVSTLRSRCCLPGRYTWRSTARSGCSPLTM